MTGHQIKTKDKLRHKDHAINWILFLKNLNLLKYYNNLCYSLFLLKLNTYGSTKRVEIKLKSQETLLGKCLLNGFYYLDEPF